MALQSTTALATITLQQASGQVIFSGIPTSYRDLIIVANADGTVQTELYLRFNEDTSSNYHSVRMQASGSTIGGNSQTSATFLRLNGNGDIMPDFSFSAIIQFLDYSVTNKHKQVLSRTNSSNGLDACAGRWSNTGAIESITLYPNAGSFEAGSTFCLYGRVS